MNSSGTLIVCFHPHSHSHGLNSILSSKTKLTLPAAGDLDDVAMFRVFASMVDQFSMLDYLKKKKREKNSVSRERSLEEHHWGFCIITNLKHTVLAQHSMVKIVISDVLFDTRKQKYLYKTLGNWIISVPVPASWLSRSSYVLSDFKRLPAELTLSRPSTSLCCLTVFVFVCDIHLIVFDGLIPMIYFEYNKTPL